jgi:hypothetical protein
MWAYIMIIESIYRLLKDEGEHQIVWLVKQPIGYRNYRFESCSALMIVFVYQMLTHSYWVIITTRNVILQWDCALKSFSYLWNYSTEKENQFN